MKKMALVTIWLLGVVAAGQAEIQLIDLTVRKSTKQEMQQAAAGKNIGAGEGTETVAYTIEALNRSAGALPELTIKWAVLVGSEEHGNYSHPSELRMIEGERKVSLDFGQRTIFYTDLIDLDVYHSAYYGRSGEKIEGYVVEVFQGTNVLASKAIPMATKKRIEALRAKHNKK